jgi:hypothetical protein
MSKAYRFIEQTHTHTIGGSIVPGVTTVLKPLYNFSAVPEHILKAACSFGTAVHSTIELYCTGCLDIDALDPLLRPSLDGFKHWLNSVHLAESDFIAEVPMGNSTLMYGGIPDLILDGRLIIEIKTRKCNHLTDSIQTAAQEDLWKHNGGSRIKEYERRVLYLAPDGQYEYTKVNDKQAWSKFRKLLDHYNDIQLIQTWRK